MSSASKNSRFSIGVVIPYFGQWPEWAPLYFETLKKNTSIDFIFYTDCDTSITNAPNIIFKSISFQDYIRFVNSKINVEFNPPNAYKICDLRPLFGHIHRDDFKSYDFYGWIDMDLLLGDVRYFYTEQILSLYNVLSTHAHRISGHFSLFRNTRTNRNMYKKIYNWKGSLLEKEFVGIDEHGITNAYLHTIFDKLNEKFKLHIDFFLSRFLSKQRKKKLYMVEQYTTPFTPLKWMDGTVNSAQPDVWYYKDGTITNSRDGQRKFIYIHWMNFKSSRWRWDGTKAPWENVEKICFAKVEDMKEGIIINHKGMNPLASNIKD